MAGPCTISRLYKNNQKDMIGFRVSGLGFRLVSVLGTI